MEYKQFLIYVYERLSSIMSDWRVYHDEDFKFDRIAAELMRNSHSIEKGLCIAASSIRLGFGHNKQYDMIKQIDVLSRQKNPYYDEVVSIALATLDSYVEYHQRRKYSDDCIEKIRSFLMLNTGRNELNNSGGVDVVHKSDLSFDMEQITCFFQTRHSIRDFDDTPVDESKILQAVALAQKSPSACNRQGVRVYSAHASEADELREWLGGTGGFEGHVQELLLITGKMSAYRAMEHAQYIVSASIFASYLSLALHAVKLGCCIIQRNVEYSKKWRIIRDKLNIPKDEQVICMLGVGNLKDATNVPVSERLSLNIIYKRIM